MLEYMNKLHNYETFFIKNKWEREDISENNTIVFSKMINDEMINLTLPKNISTVTEFECRMFAYNIEKVLPYEKFIEVKIPADATCGGCKFLSEKEDYFRDYFSGGLVNGTFYPCTHEEEPNGFPQKETPACIRWEAKAN